jgi:protein-S-isoprenylcysteine O-methyltransferase Ste14
MLESGAFFFKYRNAVFPIVFVLVAVFSRPSLFLNDPSIDRATTLLGVVLTLCGQALRLAVIGYAYIKRGGKDGKVFAETLVIRGFYAHCRNPMYTGNLMIGIGLAILYGSWVSYAVAAPFFVFVYLAITETEENYLRHQFGEDYARYTRAVNRFIPDFTGLDKSLKDFRYDWKRAIRKDYGTIFGSASGIIIIAGWKAYLFRGAESLRALAPFLVLFSAVSTFYIFARIFKKSGYLSSPNN